jgi:hypothetical protein
MHHLLNPISILIRVGFRTSDSAHMKFRKLSRKNSFRPPWKLDWVFAARMPRGTIGVQLQYRLVVVPEGLSTNVGSIQSLLSQGQARVSKFDWLFRDESSIWMKWFSMRYMVRTRSALWHISCFQCWSPEPALGWNQAQFSVCEVIDPSLYSAIEIASVSYVSCIWDKIWSLPVPLSQRKWIIEYNSTFINNVCLKSSEITDWKNYGFQFWLGIDVGIQRTD